MANRSMKHWYVVKKSNSDSLKVGDIIGYSQQNPNLARFLEGHFVPGAEWLYIGRWETPPIDELTEAMNLVHEMSDDLLTKAEALCQLPLNGGHFADRYLDISRIVTKLVAEVKRLRGSMEDLELICVADEQRYKEQLAAKDAEINELQWIKTYRIDEKELQFQYIVTKANAEIHKWQEIAMEEKAKQMDGPCVFRTSHEWCNETKDHCDGYPHMWGECPNKRYWRSKAAKELSITDSYLSRLEQAFTMLYILHLRDMDKDVVEKHAKETLEKIRHAEHLDFGWERVNE